MESLYVTHAPLPQPHAYESRHQSACCQRPPLSNTQMTFFFLALLFFPACHLRAGMSRGPGPSAPPVFHRSQKKKTALHNTFFSFLRYKRRHRFAMLTALFHHRSLHFLITSKTAAGVGSSGVIWKPTRFVIAVWMVVLVWFV
ncbi:unnamed protein product [Periconia digitata]|uniref:Uncharacterized protein n=1 Tax=Periconia digitata TaxID=1303443 RepID=A0A9W4XSN0_9PLEO|nr:unnamed protein product [Periconia digitata]